MAPVRFASFALLAALCAPRLHACETALLFAMDVSNSIDPAEYAIQAEGLALALRDPEIAEIMVEDRVALAVLQWSGPPHQAVTLDWRQISEPADLTAFAEAAAQMERAFVLSDTAPGAALQAALNAMEKAPPCKRRVVDVSGDGTPNSGPSASAARVRAERAGVTVNGLAIEGPGHGLPVSNYYRQVLITRDGFVMTARSHRDFAETLRRKILREIARVLG
ncbi:DUF1194 domain-containing protein [Alloyangia pacifica]|uniref:Ca-activated chloride channel family protein n=1 Tax=Alloyangia pacifica TaxID=311180 RepID=A0A1I6PCJ9_9RHOB|nr:DUF1194 domain-containing protein [Alloyangia pacifica]SDG24550.1 Ca-activated chloride channel family protein [Alloyangia pacifica]SFS37893.1 Ca-activated chloride channel family protein [Alloyangia pacifica]